MSESKKCPEVTSAQPLEQDVVRQCLMKLETESSSVNIERDEMLVTLILLVQSLSKNVFSGDVWQLSYMSAIKQAEMLGIDKNKFEETLNRVQKIQGAITQSSPMYKLFGF